MENMINSNGVVISKNFIKKSINKAYEEFGNNPMMSTKQYAKDKKISLYDAQALDLNDDDFIDLSERASEICAKKALKLREAKTGEIPTMILLLLQDKLGLKKAQEEFIQENYPENTINITA